MKIACFDLEPWEQDFLREQLPDLDLQLFESSLEMSHVDEISDAETLVVFIYSPVSAEIIERLPNLRLVATASTGYDHIDLDACKARDITVCNVPTYGENTVAEHTFGLLLNLTRKIHKAYLKTTQGDFSLDGLRGIDLKGRTMGLVGMGHIGEHVARIAKGFEMEVLICDPAKPGSVSYEELLKNSDIISFHCPLNESTRHLFNKDSLKLCRKGVYIINTARGPVIETEALLLGLKNETIAGVGLDVLEEEQCMIREEKEILSRQFDDSCLRVTLENHVLLRHPKAIITPHNAFNSEEALQRIFQTTADNVKAFASGSPINVVSR